MSSSSDSSHTPPGQQSAEVPQSLKYDDVTSFLWAAVMLLFPPMWVDSDKPLHKRFWAWRYIYSGFFLVSAIFFAPELLAGDYDWLFLFPFAHVVAALSLAGLFAGYPMPGLSLPLVSYQTTVVLYGTGIVLTLASDALRRTSPAMFARNPWESEDGQSVVPLEVVANKDDDADTPPTLDQDISTAVIGETGSGKTSMMRLLAYQFPYDRDTAVIAHDTGEEFQQFYTDLGFDVKRISATDSDVVWNLFQDADSESEFREVAGAIFGEPDGNNPFHRPAKQTFQDMLLYLHLEAQRNNRRQDLCHTDIVSLLDQGHYALKEALDEYDRLDSGHIDPDKGKGAQNVYQTLRENVRPVFVDDFADYGQFSLEEYIKNPDGRVLIIDSDPSRMETLGPMYQLLLDWSIRYAMNSPNPTVHILDEIDALPSLTQVTNLTARGRKNKARALIGVQTIGQLEDTYSTISGIVGNCPQGVYFGPGDAESTEFVLDELGERRQLDRTEMVAMSHQGRNESARTQSRDTYKEKDKTPITSGLLRDFEPGECIVVSRTTWWHGQSCELHEVRDDLPEMGAESPATPRTEDEDDEDLEDHDSWIGLARSKAADLTDDTDDADSTDDAGDIDGEMITTGDESDSGPAVWAAETDATPYRTFTQGGWEQTLCRLDVQEPPITEKQNVDAIRDIATMLDDRVLTLPESVATTEIRELLADIVAQTGLSETQTLDIVTDRTEILRVNEQFEESFTQGGSEFSASTGNTAENPFAQDTSETNAASLSESMNAEESNSESNSVTPASGAEPAADDAAPSDIAPDTQTDDQQSTLDDLDEQLADDTVSQAESTTAGDSKDVDDAATQDGDITETSETDEDDDHNAHEFM
ncbi:type IV secretion system DNA-binding domain-containing protein [Halomicroarcula sp. F28]|nr:type IV secretion system DNA-binding domain-containing protein [Halomicroarcula salinisoli]